MARNIDDYVACDYGSIIAHIRPLAGGKHILECTKSERHYDSWVRESLKDLFARESSILENRFVAILIFSGLSE